MDAWQEKRILVLGTTYPSHSQTYNEIVCTVGIEEDSCRMVRLHPVPMRYLDPAHRFKKFQFIRVRMRPHDSDPRPESYRIDPKSIVVEEKIDSHEVRRSYIENSPHLIGSVEELKDKQLADGTSLGIIKPKDILDCLVEYKPESDRAAWKKQENIRMSQQRLFGESPKPLDFPEAKFVVHWRCDDATCQTHKMGILQWGIHELYRKLSDDPDRQAKIIDAMRKQLDEWDRDIFLFLGNFRAIPYNFGLMDSYSAPSRTHDSRLFT